MFQADERKIRKVQTVSPFTEKLTKIKLMLLKVINNAVPATYIDLRELRKRFNSLNAERNLFSFVDKDKADEIKILLNRLKETHPEICSKNEFKKSECFKALQETNLNSPSNETNQNTSKVLSSSIAHHPASQSLNLNIEFHNQRLDMDDVSQKNPEPGNSSDTQNTNGTQDYAMEDLTLDDVVESCEISQDDINKNYLKYQKWAKELFAELEKQQ